jgi:hypothetical protein
LHRSDRKRLHYSELADSGDWPNLSFRPGRKSGVNRRPSPRLDRSIGPTPRRARPLDPHPSYPTPDDASHDAFRQGWRKVLIDCGIIIGIARSHAGLFHGRPSEFIVMLTATISRLRHIMPPHDPRKRNPLSLERSSLGPGLALKGALYRLGQLIKMMRRLSGKSRSIVRLADPPSRAVVCGTTHSAPPWSPQMFATDPAQLSPSAMAERAVWWQ